MVVKRPGFFGEHTLICASLPQTFKVTLGEVHDWNTAGTRATERELEEFDGVMAKLLEDP